MNVIEPTPPRVLVGRGRKVSTDSYFSGNDSGAEAFPLSDEEQRRAEKRERRRSPLARLTSPRLFRRDSADGRAIPPRVGSPILPLKARLGRSEGNKLRMSESMTNIDDPTGATRRGPRQGRHNSFDYVPVPERERAASGAGPSKVRFAQENDSGVSGVESEGSSGRVPTQQSTESGDNSKGDPLSGSGLTRSHSAKVNGEREGRRPRPRSSPPLGTGGATGNTARAPSSAAGRATIARGPTSGTTPMGGLSSGSLLPHFEFESTTSSPVPSPARSTFGASLPVSTRVKNKRPRPIGDSVAAGNDVGLSSRSVDVRRGKGRSLDLGIGLLWAPQRVREDAVMTFGNAGVNTRNKWALDPRMSELYIGENDAMQFGVIKANRDEVLGVYRDTLGEQADLTFRRCKSKLRTSCRPLIT